MEEPASKKSETKPRLACYIRLNQREHDRLQKDVLKSGKKATTLIKKAYFDQNPVVLLMSDPDRDHFFSEINRIGNNVNQVAKKLNSGFAYGFHQDLETIRSQLTILITWVTAKYRSFKL